jgi:hypothetical protein
MSLMITFGFASTRWSRSPALASALAPGHVEHAGTVGSGETVGSSSGSSEFSPGWSSTEMISDGRSNPDGKVLVKCVG